MWQKRKYQPYIRPTHQYQLATLYFSFKRCAFAFPGLCLNEFPIHQSYKSLKQDVYQGRYINNRSFKMHVLIDMSNQFYNSLWISNCHKYNCFKKKFSKVFYRIYSTLACLSSGVSSSNSSSNRKCISAVLNVVMDFIDMTPWSSVLNTKFGLAKLAICLDAKPIPANPKKLLWRRCRGFRKKADAVTDLLVQAKKRRKKIQNLDNTDKC